MKLQFRQIEPFVKKPDPAALMILVYGPDEGLVRERVDTIAKTVIPDLKDPFSLTEISGKQLADTPSLLLDEAQSMSMLGGRKVIKLSLTGATDGEVKSTEKPVEDALKALRSGDNLVLIEAGDLGKSSKLRTLCESAANAAAVPCYVEDERDLTRLIADSLKAQGFVIESEALVYMAANVIGDRAVVRGEIEKLITYMGKESRRVRIDDVTACIGDSADLSIDLLGKHASSGQFYEADRILKFLLSEGIAAVSILRTLQNYFMRLHITKARVEKGDNLEIAMKRLRPEVFWKHKDAFVAQVSALSMPQLDQILALLMGVEVKCKQTASDPDTLISRAILSISQLSAKALARRRA